MFESTLRNRIQNDPYYRLQSVQEIRIAAKLGVRINVNRAGVDDWLRLPGLSIHQARALVQLTQSGLSFYSLADLAAVLNVSVERIRPWEPVLSFQYFDPKSLEAQPKLNLNAATLEELYQVLPDDPELCQRIMDERSQAGSYRDFANLQTRLRLPASVMAELIHRFKF